MKNAHQETINRIKSILISKGWFESKSAKYLHNEINNQKYRIVFKDMAFRIERKLPPPWHNQWQNVRSAYYKDITFTEKGFSFGKVGNDIFTEMRSLEEPSEIKQLIQPKRKAIEEFDKLVKNGD